MASHRKVLLDLSCGCRYSTQLPNDDTDTKGMKIMENLTMYSDDELSLRVFKDEYFYIERQNRAYLMALVAEEFLYTSEQLEVLKQELIYDINED